MPKMLKSITALNLIAAAITSIAFYFFHMKLCLTLAITFGTISYHLGMRLLVGFLYNAGMRNQTNYTKRWYQVQPWEVQLYDFLNVKSWKNRLPTYEPLLFSPKKHTWTEIAQAMCQAELVHETNMILSFIPIIACKWFGAFYVFLITSICGGIDICRDTKV